MGLVGVAAKSEDTGHLAMVERGFMAAFEILCVEVADALGDLDFLVTGMPTRMIRPSELMPFRTHTELKSDGIEI